MKRIISITILFFILFTNIYSNRYIIHEVHQNESLTDIAGFYYNNESLYRKIIKDNNLENDIIYPGQKLKIYSYKKINTETKTNINFEYNKILSLPNDIRKYLKYNVHCDTQNNKLSINLENIGDTDLKFLITLKKEIDGKYIPVYPYNTKNIYDNVTKIESQKKKKIVIDNVDYNKNYILLPFNYYIWK